MLTLLLKSKTNILFHNIFRVNCDSKSSSSSVNIVCINCIAEVYTKEHSTYSIVQDSSDYYGS